MTVGDNVPKSIIVLPSMISSVDQPITVFTLPHPSNNESKERVQLIEPQEGQVYELKSHCFSRGCTFNAQSDLAEDRYHYTNDSQPIKSTLLTNEQNRKDAYVMESGDFQFTTKYDITFSLIGFYYRESIAKDEGDFDVSDLKLENVASQPELRFLTVRDHHDMLVDAHDSQWCNVSLQTLSLSLSRIAESIEEAGDTYYKVTPEKITEYLVCKVQRISSNFPKCLPLPAEFPAEIIEFAKIRMAVNLLISVIPKRAYLNLLRYSPKTNSTGISVDVSNAYLKYDSYKKSIIRSSEDRELLVREAMTVGLPIDSGKGPVKKIIKKSITLKKQKIVGKGAIDGFFKSAKKNAS